MLTKEQHQFIKEQLTLGNTYKFIGDKVGVSREYIRQLAQRYKIFPLKVRQEKRNKELYLKYKDKYGNKEFTPSDLFKAQKEKFCLKKSNALRTGYVMNACFGDINWPTHCPILGLELDYFADHRKETSVSFDRIDTTQGYNKDNIQIVSWRANRIKNDGTADEHRKIADYLDTLNKD